MPRDAGNKHGKSGEGEHDPAARQRLLAEGCRGDARGAGTGNEGLAAPTTSRFNDPRATGAEGCGRTSPGPARALCDGSAEIAAVFAGDQDGKPKPNGKGQC